MSKAEGLTGLNGYHVARSVLAPEVNIHNPDTMRKRGCLRVFKHKIKMKYKTHSSERGVYGITSLDDGLSGMMIVKVGNFNFPIL